MMKPTLRNILLGGLTLGLGKVIYEKGKQDQRRDFKNGINQFLAEQKMDEMIQEQKQAKKAEKKQSKESK